MPYNRLEIKNFQSLRDVTVELGKLTVITGESVSGKSAFMRALQALASNMRGTVDITQGEAATSISMVSDDYRVTLHRTVKNKDDYYKILNLTTGEERDFRTLSGKVPEEVTEALKIDPVHTNDPSVNFHVQEDKPYLLTSSGADVARELGELTNVNEIFEAVREGNRRRLNLNSELKSRQKDVDSILAASERFVDLQAKEEALRLAEESLKRAEVIQGNLNRLMASTQAVKVAGQIVSRKIPSMEVVYSLKERLEELTNNLQVIRIGQQAYTKATKELSNSRSLQAALEEQLHDKLEELGTCPLCGSNTSSTARR